MAIKEDVVIYENGNEKSNAVAAIKFTGNCPKIEEKGVKAAQIDDSLLLYNSESNFAALTIEADTDEWYYVCYDRKRKLFGWIKKAENTDFMTWQDFFNLYGRKYGIYIFRNVPDSFKKLYSAPNADSTQVDDFYYAKHIALWLIAGDWMLVKVTTYDGKTKTGWLRWRLESGTVIAFPDFGHSYIGFMNVLAQQY